MTALKLRLNYTDVSGNESNSLLYCTGTEEDIALVALADNIAACSVGQVERVQAERTIAGPDSGNGGSGAYSTHRDMATLLFKTAANITVKLTIVAPDEAIFLADAETVNLANVNVAALVADCLSHLTDTQENPVVRCERGYRWRMGD